MGILQAIITALYFIIGGILLFLAFSIVRDNISNRLNKITGLMLFFAALGPIFIALGAIVKQNASVEAPFEESLIYNLLYSWEFFFPSFLLFSWVFPLDRLSHLKHPRLRYLIFFPHFFHLFLAIFFNRPEKILRLLDVQSSEGFSSLILEPVSYVLKWLILGFTIILSSEKSLFAVVNLSYIVLGVYYIIKGRSQIINEQLRKQCSTITAGISIAVGIYTVFFLIPDIISYQLSPSLRTAASLLALFIGGGAIMWSIVRFQFLDVTVLVRQSLVYTISSALLVGLYVLLIGQADRLLTSVFGAKLTIVNIAFIVTFLILFQPINSQLDNLIKRFFIRSRADYRNIMEDLSRRLISVFDPAQVRSMIEISLKSTILVEKIYFVLFDDKIQEYVLLGSEGFPDRVIIDREDLFLGGVNQLEHPTAIDRLSLYRKGSVLYSHMEKRRVQLVLPLKDADHMLGLLALTHKESGYRYNAEDISMLGVLSNQLVTVLTNTRLYADSLEKQRLHEEITMARQIQLDLLPKHPPCSESFSIYPYSMPSRMIGGDFYDFILKNDGCFGMVVADASGKGMPAALLVAQIQAMLRSEVGNSDSISRIMSNINAYITELTSSEKFATMFYAEFNPAVRRLRYSNAGHNHPMVIHSDGTCEYLDRGGIPIGAFGGANYEDDIIELREGDLLFIYTDGLSEAMNENEEEYGEKRIREFLIKQRFLQPRDIVDSIINDVRQFDPSDPPRDDTTIIALKLTKGVD
jgi:sigma-B regulation protein RsbU (phosphoserine phosphatase)